MTSEYCSGLSETNSPKSTAVRILGSETGAIYRAYVAENLAVSDRTYFWHSREIPQNCANSGARPR